MDVFDEEQLKTNDSLSNAACINNANKGLIEKARVLIGYLPLAIPVVIFSVYFIYLKFVLPYTWNLFTPGFIFISIILIHYDFYSVLYHWWKAFTIKPSSIPINYYKKLVDEKNRIESCNICKQEKYPRTHHCSVCDHCIVRYDHHCAWLSCIGLHNIRHFYLFLLHATCSATLFSYMLIVILYNNNDDDKFPFKLLLLITIVTVNLFFSCFLQCIFQTIMISLNFTMVEMITSITTFLRIKKFYCPFYTSLIENWRDAFLVRKDYSLLFYFLPYTPSFEYNMTIEDLDDITIDV